MLDEITEAVTGLNKNDYYWHSKKESIRNIYKSLKYLIRDEEVNDFNKDRYIEIYKLIYNDHTIKSLINKQANIIKNTKIVKNEMILPTEFREKKIKIKNRKFRIEDKNREKYRIIEVPKKKFELTIEEHIKISEILLEFFRGEEKGYLIEEFLKSAKSEEYNSVLAEFEKEVESIKISIHGYSYEGKVEKMKEIADYLKKQREEIDKNIIDNLILPEEY